MGGRRTGASAPLWEQRRRLCARDELNAPANIASATTTMGLRLMAKYSGEFQKFLKRRVFAFEPMLIRI